MNDVSSRKPEDKNVQRFVVADCGVLAAKYTGRATYYCIDRGDEADTIFL